MAETENPLLPFAEPMPTDSFEYPEAGVIAAKTQKIAPPGSMQHGFWMADDFDESIDNLFNCLQDASHDPLDQG